MEIFIKLVNGYHRLKSITKTLPIFDNKLNKFGWSIGMPLIFLTSNQDTYGLNKN